MILTRNILIVNNYVLYIHILSTLGILGKFYVYFIIYIFNIKYSINTLKKRKIYLYD